jgi:hypothetical protein
MSIKQHEHEFEPQPGLPERLPADETILWQGAPAAAWVARRVFHLRWVLGYFALLTGWQVVLGLHDGESLSAVAALAGAALLPAGLAIALLGLLAWLTARTTLYTLTNKRVVMRVGIVLTVTYNLPLRSIDAAHVLPLADGHGDVALALKRDVRIAIVHLWPHARPWFLRQPQPMLRCLPDVQGVAGLLAAAWSVANAQPARAERRPAPEAARGAAAPVGAGAGAGASLAPGS